MRILIIYFDSFYSDFVYRFRKRPKEYEVDYIAYDLLACYLEARRTAPPDVVILAGSYFRILEQSDVPQVVRLIRTGIPIIGVCYGFQLLALLDGGRLHHGRHLHRGHRFIRIKETEQQLFFNHFDTVVELPEGWRVHHRFSKNKRDESHSFVNMASKGNWWGFQFHPEKTQRTFDRFILPILQRIQRGLKKT